MRSAENLAGIESEGRRLGQAARRDPDRAVPQYPDWTLADLASHTASIHGRTAQICRERPVERVSAPRLPEGRDPIDWYEETLDEMLEALRESDPDAACWGLVPESDIGFWERRMVVETGLHRWDAYQAFGEEDRLTDLVARSGLEEFGDLWLRHLGDVSALEVTAEDLDETWTYGASEPEERVVGAASDLFLRLMSRPSQVRFPEAWEKAVDGLGAPPKR